MKKIIVLTFLATNITIVSAIAENSSDTSSLNSSDISNQASVQNFGFARYEKKNISKVQVYGPAVFEGTTVTETAQISGPMNAEDARFKNLVVNGPCNLKGSFINEAVLNGPVKVQKVTVTGKIEINGPLKARDSHFKGPISIAARKITFEGSDATNLELRTSRNAEDKKGQIVILKNSIISGNITFEEGNGKVFLTRGSKVKGQVKGGQLIEK
ncbi:MAG: hypothetical protein IBJ00_00135 [Alphaproteobacteria bacterium]|nr:hypothetical protein [Alphaproteobacteria bacterium]